jgi:HlyD family secretion protein
MMLRLATRLGLCGALVLPLASCGADEPPAEPVVPVQTAPVTRGAIQRTVSADAVLYPVDQATIVPKISAPVKRFLVQRGDHVKQGQLLAVLENSDLAAAAAQAKGQYEQAQANYRSVAGASVPEEMKKAQGDVRAAKEALDAAGKVLDSRQALFEQGAIARKLVDEAQVAYAQAKAQYDTAALQSIGQEATVQGAEAQRQAAKGQYEAAQAQMSYSEIRSPISGVVTERPLYAGEMANAGSPLLTVMDVSSVVARANLSQAQATGLHVGDAATLTPAERGEPVAGEVTVVSPAVDPNSTTVQVWVQAPNPGERLRAGGSVHVDIVAATIDDALLVPPSAVLPSADGGTHVLVVDAKKIAHEQPVEVGVRQPDKVQVLGGVSAGQPVVTVGGLGLEDGATVRVVTPGEDGGSKDGGK